MSSHQDRIVYLLRRRNILTVPQSFSTLRLMILLTLVKRRGTNQNKINWICFHFVGAI